MDFDFPFDTKFLVTGGAGFIGSNIVEFLLKKGYKVRVLDNFITGKKENIEPFYKYNNFEFIEGDIRNIDTCFNACDSIDYVLHQAALGSIPRSIKNPILTNEINVSGFLNMLEASTQKHVKRFIYASSSSVYGNSESLPKIEGFEGSILSPYALTKKINELYAYLYNEIFNLKVIGLRYFNVYGPRQDPNSLYSAVIPKFINGLINNEDIYINGDGSNSRDFTYVEDVVQANLKACLCNQKYCKEVYNVGHGGNTTIKELYYKIAKILHINKNPIYKENRAGDMKHSIASIKKAKECLNYETKYNIDEGLKKTIPFYLKK